MRRGLFQTAAIATLLVGVAAAKGAEVEKDVPKKPAWQWTLDERLAARFDPEAMAARQAEHEAEWEAVLKRWESWGSDLFAQDEVKRTEPPAATETIDGSKTPELLLPMELFSTLLIRAFPAEKERVGLQELRSKIEVHAAALGIGRDLWVRLGKVAAPYLRPLYAEDERRLATGAKDYENKGVGLRICRARAKAFVAAKAEFGEEAFLRLLYEAVAPAVRRTYLLGSWPPDYQRHAEELRFQAEGGCR